VSACSLTGVEEKLKTACRKERGDRNIFLVNTTNWVTWADVFPDNQHPNVEGHQKIAGLFTSWLEKFGVTGETVWEAASRE